MRILLVEDDRKAARLLARGLQEEGFVVDVVHSAEQGEDESYAVDYDVIVLDWMLPGKQGIDFCRDLRARAIQTPV
ncbi:MAG: response regulator, partial [Janthinobacterium lividum]|nr:response regulator [Janthinobacterium lividum]